MWHCSAGKQRTTGYRGKDTEQVPVHKHGSCMQNTSTCEPVSHSVDSCLQAKHLRLIPLIHDWYNHQTTWFKGPFVCEHLLPPRAHCVPHSTELRLRCRLTVGVCCDLQLLSYSDGWSSSSRRWPSHPCHGMAWNGMAWHGMAWHGMAWHGMVWHGMTR